MAGNPNTILDHRPPPLPGVANDSRRKISTSDLFHRLLPLISNDEFFNIMPPGHRFRPTDVELIRLYLMRKIDRVRAPRSRIHDVKFYDFSPQHLAEKYKPSQDKEWYFFTPRYKKYKGGKRPNRAAGDGFWKATGADKSITENGQVVGYRKSLVYYEGKSNSIKSDWMMHEYRVNNPTTAVRDSSDTMKLDDYVLCKMYKRDPRPARKKSKTNNDDEVEDLQEQEEPDEEEDEDEDEDGDGNSREPLLNTESQNDDYDAENQISLSEDMQTLINSFDNPSLHECII